MKRSNFTRKLAAVLAVANLVSLLSVSVVADDNPADALSLPSITQTEMDVSTVSEDYDPIADMLTELKDSSNYPDGQSFVSYSNNYQSSQPEPYTTVMGTVTADTPSNGQVVHMSSGSAAVLDASPYLSSGIYEITFRHDYEASGDYLQSGVGFLIKDDLAIRFDAYSSLGVSTGIDWVVQKMDNSGSWLNINGGSVPALDSNTDYTMVIGFVDDHLVLELDGVVFYDNTVSLLTADSYADDAVGQVGLFKRFDAADYTIKSISVSGIGYAEAPEAPDEPAEPSNVYAPDYDADGYTPNWSSNAATLIDDPRGGDGKVLQIGTGGDGRFVDLDSPEITNGSISLDMNVVNASTGFSIAFRMNDSGSDYAELGYAPHLDDWIPETTGSWGSTIGVGVIPMSTWMSVIINFSGDDYQVYINGENRGSFSYDFIDSAGHFGMRSRYATILIDDLVYSTEAAYPPTYDAYENDYTEGVTGDFAGATSATIVQDGTNNILALVSDDVALLTTQLSIEEGTAQMDMLASDYEGVTIAVADSVYVSVDGDSWTVTNGDESASFSGNAAVPTAGKWNSIGLSFEGAVLTLSVNGRTSTAILDSEIAVGGTLGLSTAGNTLYIDNLSYSNEIIAFTDTEGTDDVKEIYEAYYDLDTTPNFSNMDDADVADGVLTGTIAANTAAINLDVPAMDNAVYQAKMSGVSGVALGNLLFYVEGDNWVYAMGEITGVIGANSADLDQLYVLRLESVQGEISLYVNNRLVGSVALPGFDAGDFGVYNSTDSAATLTLDAMTAEELRIYAPDYTDDYSPNWAQTSGTAVSATVADGALTVPMGVYEAYDLDAPDLMNQTVTFDFMVDVDASSSGGRYGFVLRGGEGASDVVSITHDINGNWQAQTAGGVSTFDSSVELEKDSLYSVAISLTDLSLSLVITDATTGEVFDFGSVSLNSYTAVEGKFGLKAWYYTKNMTISNLEIVEQPSLAYLLNEITQVSLSSDNLTVVVDRDFPTIFSYQVGDDVMETGSTTAQALTINGSSYTPAVVSTVYDSSIDYVMTIDELDVVVSATLALDTNAETGLDARNVVTIDITDIQENGDFLVRTLSLGEKSFGRTSTLDEDATYAWTASGGEWHDITEGIYEDLADMPQGQIGATIATVSANGLTVSMENTVMSGGNKIIVDQQIGTFVSAASLYCGTFTYRHTLNPRETVESLPSLSIAIGTEVNGDDKVDWQDGIVVYREQILVTPYEAEDMANNMMYIPFNFASTATDPFLNSLDTAKVIYNYTDGFGQMLLHKGYQNEGHDSGIPSYDEIGVRQGGVEDFQTLIGVGDQYNVKVGVHINATEYHLDAYGLNYQNLTGATEEGPANYPTGSVSGGDSLSPGWDWVDTTFYVDQTADVLTGELQRRLTELADISKTTNADGEEVGLDFYYIDVYTGNDYNAYKLVEYVNDLGIKVGTEFAGPLEPGANFVHWGTDLGYPNTGNGSQVYRMAKNDQDLFVGNALFKGQKLAVVSTWGDSKPDVDQAIKVFFNEVLPTKYMQHFGVLKMTEDAIIFDEGVTSTRNHDDGIIELRKDGVLVSSWEDTGTTTDSSERHTSEADSLIPWLWDNDSNVLTVETGAKLYHWNTTGTSTTYTLTDVFADVDSFNLYELTQQGRIYVATIENVNGTVTLDTERNTGYVLYPSHVDAEQIIPTASDWGEGSEILDFAFNAEALDGDAVWQTEEGTSASIQVIPAEDFYDTNKETSQSLLNRYLEIDGTGAVYQDIVLKDDTGYVVSIWTQTPEGQQSTLTVQVGDKIYENTVSGIDGTHQTNFKYRYETWQRIDLDIDVPAGVTTGRVTLSTTGDGVVLYDDAKIWEHIVEENFSKHQEYVVYEDFENVSQGFGIFEYGGGSLKNQLKSLSPSDTPITTPAAGVAGPIFTWVLSGNTSLKLAETDAGTYIMTSENGLKLDANTEYDMSFKYTVESNATYEVIVRSRSNTKDILLQETLAAFPSQGDGTYNEVNFSFTTGNLDDYQVIFNEKSVLGGYTELHAFILDDFGIKLTADETVIGATLSMEVATTDVAADSSTFQLMMDASNLKALFFEMELPEGAVMTAGDNFGLHQMDTNVYMLAYQESSEDTLTGYDVVAATITIVDALGATVTISDATVATTADTAEAVIAVASASTTGIFALAQAIADKVLAIESLEALYQSSDYLSNQWTELEALFDQAIETVAGMTNLGDVIDYSLTDLKADADAIATKLDLMDLNNDGSINHSDIAAIAFFYGHAVDTSTEKYDVNGDNTINCADYLMIYQNM